MLRAMKAFFSGSASAQSPLLEESHSPDDTPLLSDSRVQEGLKIFQETAEQEQPPEPKKTNASEVMKGGVFYVLPGDELSHNSNAFYRVDRVSLKPKDALESEEQQDQERETISRPTR